MGIKLNPRRVLPFAVLAVMALLAFLAGRPKDYEMGDYFDLKGVQLYSSEYEFGEQMDAYVASLVYEGKDPPALLSRTSGEVFGIPVEAVNYCHAAYHGSPDCIMSVLFDQGGTVLAVAYEAPYKKTSEIEKNLDGYYERQEAMSGADPVFDTTWLNVVGMTVSVGEHDGRNVFLVSDVRRMGLAG